MNYERNIQQRPHSHSAMCHLRGSEAGTHTLRRAPFSMRPGKKTGARSADYCKQKFHGHGAGRRVRKAAVVSIDLSVYGLCCICFCISVGNYPFLEAYVLAVYFCYCSSVLT